MKQLFFILVLVSAGLFTSAQEYLNDSTDYYLGGYQAWTLQTRETVLHRNNKYQVTSALVRKNNPYMFSWSDRYKISYEYYEDSLTVKTYYKEVWNSNYSQWYDLERTEYNINGDITLKYEKEWDFENNLYISGDKYIYTYNDTLQTSLERDTLNCSNQTWYKYAKNEYTYLSDGKVDVVKSLIYNNGWENNILTKYSYNSEGYIYQIKLSYYAGGSWNNISLVTNIYNENNNLTERYYQTYSGSNWVNTYKYLYTYNDQNLPESKTKYTWQSTQWEENTKTINSYNENLQITKELNQIYLYGWLNSTQTIYEYDENNDLIKMQKQKWYSFNWIDNETTYYYNRQNQKCEYTKRNLQKKSLFTQTLNLIKFIFKIFLHNKHY